MEIINLNGSPTIVAEVNEFRVFKKWIEGTRLYHSILQYSGTNIAIRSNEIGEEDISLLEVHDRKIRSVDELPLEVLFEFYRNYPNKTEPTYRIVPILPKEVSKESDNIITDQRREDMLVGALEGGSNYWYYIKEEDTEVINRFRDHDEHEPFSIAMWKAIMAGRVISIYDIESKGFIGAIGKLSIENGEKAMHKYHPLDFMHIITENDDTSTADMWFQYCVMGEIVYG